MSIFNMEKQPDYISEFAKAKIACIGGGAVGSAVVEAAIKMGIEDITVIDFDPLEAENLSKSSSLYRYPEDIGKNKAVALAERANELLGKNCVKGIDANITMFGPMAFAGYDAILAPLDNYAAKVYVNQIWKQIPKEVRPELIWGGTNGEHAQSNSINGEGPCLRCTLDEAWLTNGLERSSCTGIQYRTDSLHQEIVKTTGLASGLAAKYMVEQLRCRLLNIKEAANKRIMYTPFPNMQLRVVTPMMKKACPDCKNYNPPSNFKALKNCDVYCMTLRELFEKLEAILGEDEYAIKIPCIEMEKIMYGGLIVKDYCRCCGKELKGPYRHEFRTKYRDLLCDECKTAGNLTNESYRNTKIGKTIRVLTKENCDEDLLNHTLFSLGFTIGGFLQVTVRNSQCMDILDEGFEREYTFYCEDDNKLLQHNMKVEG